MMEYLFSYKVKGYGRKTAACHSVSMLLFALTTTKIFRAIFSANFRCNVTQDISRLFFFQILGRREQHKYLIF